MLKKQSIKKNFKNRIKKDLQKSKRLFMKIKKLISKKIDDNRQKKQQESLKLVYNPLLESNFLVNELKNKEIYVVNPHEVILNFKQLASILFKLKYTSASPTILIFVFDLYTVTYIESIVEQYEMSSFIDVTYKTEDLQVFDQAVLEKIYKRKSKFSKKKAVKRKNTHKTSEVTKIRKRTWKFIKKHHLLFIFGDKNTVDTRQILRSIHTSNLNLVFFVTERKKLIQHGNYFMHNGLYNHDKIFFFLSVICSCIDKIKKSQKTKFFTKKSMEFKRFQKLSKNKQNYRKPQQQKHYYKNQGALNKNNQFDKQGNNYNNKNLNYQIKNQHNRQNKNKNKNQPNTSTNKKNHHQNKKSKK